MTRFRSRFLEGLKAWISSFSAADKSRPLRSRLGIALTLTGLLFGLVLGCGSSSFNFTNTGQSLQTRGVNDPIILGTTAKLRTLDPADAYEFWSGNLLHNLGDRLYSYELDSTDLRPQLAKALPQVSSDGLTYTIPLRQGVVFHDGTAFNAEAMAFSLRRFMENGGQPSFLLSDVVSSIQATGEFELTIRLKQPFVAFPKLLAFTGLCAVSPAAYTLGEGQFEPDRFVGTGPYRLAQLGTDSLKLEVFDQYWGDPPANVGINVQRYSNSAMLFNAFRTGAIDVAYQSMDVVQTRTLQDRAQQAGWQVVEGTGLGIYYLSVNVKSSPLDQLPVRQAIAAAMNRALLRERVFLGQVEPLYSLIPNAMAGAQPVFRQRYGQDDFGEARTLLSKAGYSPNHPLTLELWYRSNITNDQLAANLIRAAADRGLAGALVIQLQGVESATAYQNLDRGIYPLFLLDWSADFFDPDGYIQPFLYCSEGSAQTGCAAGPSKGQGSFYYNDRVNALIEQQRRIADSASRSKLLDEIQDILANDVPFIPLWQSKAYLYVQRGITGGQFQTPQKVPFWTLARS